jgi:ABC-type phosphate transport system permease subunit
VFDFLFGTHWSPQEAIREDQVGGSGSFGALPLFVGTLLISFIACHIFSETYMIPLRSVKISGHV